MHGIMADSYKSSFHFGVPGYDFSSGSQVSFQQAMQLIDSRYQAENALLQAIASGDEDATIRAFYDYESLMSSPLQEAFPTSADPVRDFKNAVLVMNTLFRKTIEEQHVHPIYIHEASSRLGAAIEQAESMEDLAELIREMVSTYCRLVREYSLSNYSSPIRRAILYIDLNLGTPISTRDIARDQFLSPNYLSSRFKQELGVSISDYLLDRRIRMAKRFLKSSSLSIQEIAAQVGIEDASYFSRQFRRIVGVSPLQYKKQQQRQVAK